VDFNAGIDCHKGSHTVVVLDHQGLQRGLLTFSANVIGYADLLAFVEPFDGVHFGLESTGFYGYRLAQELKRRGYVVFEVPGQVTKRHRRQGTRRGKSDSIDARAIAQAVITESERLPRFERDDAQDATRLLYDRRDRLVRKRTLAGNRLRSLALRLGLTDLPNRIWAMRVLSAIESRVEHITIELKTDEILRDELLEATVDIKRCSERIRALEKQLKPMIELFAPGLLQLEGASTVVAAGLFGHAGSLRNCRDASAFAMRAGVALVAFASGSQSAVRLNTLGNRQLNRCLHVIAMTQIRLPNNPGSQYYARKRAEGKSHRPALRTLKRQLASIVYYRLRDSSSLTKVAFQSIPEAAA